MKKNIIITCILVIIVVFVIIFISNKDKKANIQILQSEVNYVEDIKNSDEENEKVENITAEQGSTVNTKIYQISTEYDGREVAIVKPSIQFKVAIAGAIKKAKPEFDEIDELLKKAPTHTGIWINSSSREQFLNLLKKITNSNYKIDDDGYLVQTEGLIMNSQDKAIKKMENSEQLYVFDISSISYLVDEATGDIEEYPFEEMDPYQGYEYVEDNKKCIFVISENKEGKINQAEILKEILK